MIAPVSVTAMGEQLTATNRAVISGAFGMPLINQFASTEGLASRRSTRRGSAEVRAT